MRSPGSDVSVREWQALLGKLRRSGGFVRLPAAQRVDLVDSVATAYFQSYLKTERAKELDRALALWREAIALIPVTAPHWTPYRLHNLLLAFWKKHKTGVDDQPLEQASQLSAQLISDPSSNPRDRLLYRIINALASLELLDTRGGVEWLTIAVDAVIGLAEDGAPCLAGYPDPSASTLKRLHDRLDDLLAWPGLADWLNATWQRLAQARTSGPGAPELAALAGELLRLTGLHGEPPAAALDAAAAAFAAAPDDWPDRARAYRSLGLVAHQRYGVSKDPEDLDRAIAAANSAAEGFPDADEAKAEAWFELARFLTERFSEARAAEDVENIVKAYEAAADAAVADPQMRQEARRMATLAGLWRQAFDGSPGEVPERDLLETIGALFGSEEKDVVCAETLAFFALASGAIGEKTENLAHLDRAAALATLAYTALPSGTENHLVAHTYAIALLTRYELARNDSDLDNALAALRSLDFAKAPTRPIRADLHEWLARALDREMTRTGRRELLDEIVQQRQAALDLTPTRHPACPQRKARLAGSLYHRWVYHASGEDMERGLALFREAQRDNTDPALVSIIANDYGVALLAQAEASRQSAAFAAAIAQLTTSAEERAASITDRAGGIGNLMRAYIRRFDALHDPDDIRRAIGVGERGLDGAELQTGDAPVAYVMGQQSLWYRVYESLVECYLTLARFDDGSAPAARRRAFELAETAKSRLFLDLFGKASADPAALAQVFPSLEDRALLIGDFIRVSLTAPSAPQRNGAVKPGMTWARAQQVAAALGGETALVVAFLGERRSWLFLVEPGADEPLVVEAPASRLVWSNVLERMLREIAFPAPNERDTETWFQPLEPFAALRDALRPKERIMLSNHQHTSGLPWGVLVRHLGWRGADGRALPIATVPSLDYARRRAPVANGLQPALVVGDPTDQLSHAVEEAKAVSRMLGVEPLIGGAATIGAVLRRMPDAGLLHFASHGELRASRDPVCLNLADGPLSARQIL
jgi:hypothetical protein